MPRARWRLRYDPDVIAKLYELREQGTAVRAAIRALASQPEPWPGVYVVGGPVTWYELEVEGFLVGFSVSTDPEDREPTLRVYYVIEGGL